MKKYVYASIFKDEICDFLDLRDSQGYKGKEKYTLFTLDTYLFDAGLNEKTLKPDCIDGWLCSLSQRVSVNTKIVFVSHYSQFAKYLHSLGISAFIPERPIGERNYVPYIFTQEELSRLFEAADKFSGTKGRWPSFNPTHFPMILRILYGCGMRLGEVLALKVSDIDLDSGIIRVRNAKGNKDRLVPMEGSLTIILRKYINAINTDGLADILLFENRKGKQRTQAWMRHCFQVALKQAGIELLDLPPYSRNICVHCLRHTFAVHSFRKQDLAGFDSYASAPLLSIYMGHFDFDETEAYLHMTAENSSDILEAMNGYTAGIFPEVPR